MKKSKKAQDVGGLRVSQDILNIFKIACAKKNVTMKEVGERLLLEFSKGKIK
jgi:hypothetical protein